MDRFIVVAPPYSRRSGGVYALHRLSGALHRLGYWCRVAILDTDGVRAAEPADLDREVSAPALIEADEPIVSESIVIYPEIVTANILQATRVVWFLLNRDGALGRGRIEAGPNDYFLAHSKGVADPRTNRVLYCVDFHPAFRLGDNPVPWEHRNITLTYAGKGGLYGPCQLAPGSVAISKEWPRDQIELARLLQATKYLFTWDAWSSLNTEAVLCGAMPVILRWGPWSPKDLENDEIGPCPYLEYGEHVLGGEWKVCLFPKQRERLEKKIIELEASWAARVRAFAEDAIAHWS